MSDDDRKMPATKKVKKEPEALGAETDDDVEMDDTKAIMAETDDDDEEEDTKAFKAETDDEEDEPERGGKVGSLEIITSYTVNELRKELADRGLSTEGRKAALVARLNTWFGDKRKKAAQAAVDTRRLKDLQTSIQEITNGSKSSIEACKAILEAIKKGGDLSDDEKNAVVMKEIYGILGARFGQPPVPAAEETNEEEKYSDNIEMLLWRGMMIPAKSAVKLLDNIGPSFKVLATGYTLGFEDHQFHMGVYLLDIYASGLVRLYDNGEDEPGLRGYIIDHDNLDIEVVFHGAGGSYTISRVVEAGQTEFQLILESGFTSTVVGKKTFKDEIQTMGYNLAIIQVDLELEASKLEGVDGKGRFEALASLALKAGVDDSKISDIRSRVTSSEAPNMPEQSIADKIDGRKMPAINKEDLHDETIDDRKMPAIKKEIDSDDEALHADTDDEEPMQNADDVDIKAETDDEEPEEEEKEDPNKLSKNSQKSLNAFAEAATKSIEVANAVLKAIQKGGNPSNIENCRTTVDALNTELGAGRIVARREQKMSSDNTNDNKDTEEDAVIPFMHGSLIPEKSRLKLLDNREPYKILVQGSTEFESGAFSMGLSVLDIYPSGFVHFRGNKEEGMRGYIVDQDGGEVEVAFHGGRGTYELLKVLEGDLDKFTEIAESGFPIPKRLKQILKYEVSPMGDKLAMIQAKMELRSRTSSRSSRSINNTTAWLNCFEELADLAIKSGLSKSTISIVALGREVIDEDIHEQYQAGDFEEVD